MKPLRLSRSAAQTSNGMDKPLRTTGCAKAAAELKPRLAALPVCEALSASPAAFLQPQQPQMASLHHSSQGLAPSFGSHDSFDALADAGRLLSRLLDSLVGALAGRHAAVPRHVEALLARLFPAATCISATLPSSDGQGIAVTTLLHPSTAAAVACAACKGSNDGGNNSWAAAAEGGPSPPAPCEHQHQHTEPLGRGVCSFHLAVPPTGSSLRLMRALLLQLEDRLQLEAAQGAAALAARLSARASSSSSSCLACMAEADAPPQPATPASVPPQHAPAAVPAPAPLTGLGLPQAAMPADLFWETC